MVTIVDFLKNNNNTYEMTCLNGVDIAFTLNETEIIVQCGDKKWFVVVAGNDIHYDIQDVLYAYGTEIRFCEECGQPYDAGFMAGDGDWYCCQYCFKGAMDQTYGKDNWHATDMEGAYGGFYEYFNGNEWEDTGIFYTEWN